MKTILSGLALMALAAPVAAIAQPATNWQGNRGWDRDSFWRGAASDPMRRMDFLQQRIDRGASDGSLTRKEARNSRKELNNIRRDARNMGRINDREAASLNSRLDSLAQKIRWRHTDNDYRAGTGPQSNYDRRFATDYDASRYYRDDPRYQERRLSAQDEVYRGSDGRYYCKRSDGTTGLIVGGLAGGVLGNVIDGGGNRLAGTLIGGALGALAGKSIDQSSDVRCR
jgi:hypothetical protein